MKAFTKISIDLTLQCSVDTRQFLSLQLESTRSLKKVSTVDHFFNPGGSYHHAAVKRRRGCELIFSNSSYVRSHWCSLNLSGDEVPQPIVECCLSQSASLVCAVVDMISLSHKAHLSIHRKFHDPWSVGRGLRSDKLKVTKNEMDL